MKIAVNTRLLRKEKMDGIGWFTYNTLKKITANNPDIEFHFFFDSGIEEDFIFSKNIVPHNLFPPAKHALLNVIWFEWSAKRLLNKINPDLFLSPDGILSLGWTGKQYSIIHDLNFYHMPKVLKYSNRQYYNHFFPKYAAKAARIGTVSNFSKKDIVDIYDVDSSKIDVLYNGINSFFSPVTQELKEDTKTRYSNGKDYFVFTGTISPRKNIKALLQAFQIFKQRENTDIKLLIVGGNMYKSKELLQFKETLSFKDDVIFTGRLSDQELNNVTASALAMVFVPLFEGFGIPPIEAMQCGVPVIASNVSSVPEVTGDAALLVNPFDTNEIAEGMTKLYSQPALRATLIEKGKARKDLFSWDKTADLLWSSVQKAL